MSNRVWISIKIFQGDCRLGKKQNDSDFNFNKVQKTFTNPPLSHQVREELVSFPPLRVSLSWVLGSSFYRISFITTKSPIMESTQSELKTLNPSIVTALDLFTVSPPIGPSSASIPSTPVQGLTRSIRHISPDMTTIKNDFWLSLDYAKIKAQIRKVIDCIIRASPTFSSKDLLTKTNLFDVCMLNWWRSEKITSKKHWTELLSTYDQLLRNALLSFKEDWTWDPLKTMLDKKT